MGLGLRRLHHRISDSGLTSAILDNRETARDVGIVVLFGVVLAWLMIRFDGNLFVGGGYLVAVAALALTIFRLDWGLALYLFVVLLCDNFPVPGFPALTSTIGYYNNFTSITYLPPNPVILTPNELHLGLICTVWAVRQALKIGEPVVGLPPKVPYLLLAATLFAGFLVCFARGGDFVVALWEVRALMYFCIVLFLVPQIVRTKKQIRVLVWVIIVAMSIKAFQGALRYAALGFTFGRWPHMYETLTNHEDPVFLTTLVVLWLGLLVLKVKERQKIVLMCALPLFALGFIAGNRRAAIAASMVSILAFFILLPKEGKMTVLKRGGVFLVAFALYLAAFWNTQSRLAYVALQIKSTVTKQAGIRGEFDVGSAMYRENENYNLAVTFRTSPAIGIGFGSPFLMPIRLWALFPRLGTYIPHNQIFWVYVKTGALGGFFFWLFFNSFMYRGARISAHTRDPYLRVIAIVGVVAIVNQLVVSYVDMQLTFARNMVYLGVLMGLVSTVSVIETESPAKT